MLMGNSHKKLAKLNFTFTNIESSCGVDVHDLFSFIYVVATALSDIFQFRFFFQAGKNLDLIHPQGAPPPQ